MITHAQQLKLWAKRRERILALFNSGKSMSDIARQLDVTRQRVWQIVRGIK